MERIRREIAEWIAPCTDGMDAATLLAEFAPKVQNPEWGDLALPCFRVPVADCKKPPEKAQKLAETLPPHELVEGVKAEGPYLNITLKAAAMAERILPAHDELAAGGYTISDGNGQVVTMDYSSPNVAKEFSLGHLRSTMLGHSLIQLYGACGWKTIGINHLGDWGHQFGIVIVAWQDEGQEDGLTADPIPYLQALYQKYSLREKAEKKRGEREKALEQVASDDADERKRAATALADQGDEFVDKIVALLGDADDGVKEAAAKALGKLKAAAAPAVGALVELLETDRDSLQKQVIKTLAAIGGDAKAAEDALTKLKASVDDKKLAKDLDKALKEIGKPPAKKSGGKKATPKGDDYDDYLDDPKLPSDPESITARARATDDKLQAGDKEIRALWQRFLDLSIAALKKTYADLGVVFDHYSGESFFEDKMDAIVDELRAKKLLVESQGAQVVEMPEGPPCIILKGGGGTTYATRDLAAATYRHNEYSFDRNVYVVDARQSDHFKQVFTVLQKAGHDWADACRHVPFGAVRVSGSVMSTRSGNVILVEDYIETNRKRVVEIMEEKNPGLQDEIGADEYTATARAVARAAILFEMCKVDRDKDVNYPSGGEAVSFEGETGPRVQMTYAKTGSVLRNYADADKGFGEEADPSKWDGSHYETVYERQLFRLIGDYPTVLRDALADHQPAVVARYALEIADWLNLYWKNVLFLDKANPAAASSRVALLARVRGIVKQCLTLLGIESPERM